MNDNKFEITITITYPARLMKHMGRIIETIEFLIEKAGSGFSIDIRQGREPFPNKWYTKASDNDALREYIEEQKRLQVSPPQWDYRATSTTDNDSWSSK